MSWQRVYGVRKMKHSSSDVTAHLRVLQPHVLQPLESIRKPYGQLFSSSVQLSSEPQTGGAIVMYVGSGKQKIPQRMWVTLDYVRQLNRQRKNMGIVGAQTGLRLWVMGVNFPQTFFYFQLKGYFTHKQKSCHHLSPCLILMLAWGTQKENFWRLSFSIELCSI